MSHTPPASNREYHRQIADSLADSLLRRTLDKFAVEYRASRDKVFSEVAERELIGRIAEVKDSAAKHIEELYARFKQEAERRGAVVHRAADAAEACAIIARIAAENGVKRVVKSKSMTAEEVGLNAHLKKNGIDICETDLGEWIVQLRGEGPSHMVPPAIHLSRDQVADEFEKVTGEKQDHEDVQRLVKVARRELKPKFHEADMGLSGANFCIAETGTLAIVTNEGNGRLVNTLPRVHVALAGLDKLVPTIDDALTALQVLPRNATSQRITAYTTFIGGAGPCAKSPTGRKILHIVLLDNGRTKLAADPLFSQVFRCVRCGACANVCPVFRMVGGHRMGHIYVGAIGLVLTYLFHERTIAKTLCQNCIGCGSCKAVCSGGIDLPALIGEIRARFSREDGAPLPARLASVAMKNRTVFHTLLKFMRFSQRPVAGADGFVRHLPMALFGKHGFKSLPALAPKSFREQWPTLESRPAQPKMKIALFAGCAQDFAYPQHLKAAMKVFAAAGMEVVFPMTQTCCGLPLSMRDGDGEGGGPSEHRGVRGRLRMHRHALRQLRLASEAWLCALAGRRGGGVQREGDRFQLVCSRQAWKGCPSASATRGEGRLPRQLPPLPRTGGEGGSARTDPTSGGVCPFEGGGELLRFRRDVLRQVPGNLGGADAQEAGERDRVRRDASCVGLSGLRHAACGRCGPSEAEPSRHAHRRTSGRCACNRFGIKI